jgi:ABC-type sugar transport system permease subunit
MVYLVVIFVFIVGLILGLYFSFPEWKFPKKQAAKSVSTINAKQYFNELEISLFQKILASKDKSISSQDLHLIINQENYPVAELNRLRRNFLKDLNLKIQIVFGISNGIWQFDSSNDKKLKNYMLSKKFNLNQLNKIFLS